MAESEFLPAAPETTDIPSAVVLRKEVSSTVTDKSKAGEVRQKVIDQLVEAEINKRASALSAAISKRQDAAKELDKIRPDQVSFGEDGKQVSATFSKTVLEQRKQARAKLEKIDKAIDAAINDADYQALDKIGGGKEPAPAATDE